MTKLELAEEADRLAAAARPAYESDPALAWQALGLLPELAAAVRELVEEVAEVKRSHCLTEIVLRVQRERAERAEARERALRDAAQEYGARAGWARGIANGNAALNERLANRLQCALAATRTTLSSRAPVSSEREDELLTASQALAFHVRQFLPGLGERCPVGDPGRASVEKLERLTEAVEAIVYPRAAREALDGPEGET